MINRINLILRAKNITARQFAEEIGIQPSGMSHILGGRNNPSLDFVVKVLRRYPEIDANWLLLGKGQMYASDSKPDQVQSVAQMELPVGNDVQAAEGYDRYETGSVEEEPAIDTAILNTERKIMRDYHKEGSAYEPAYVSREEVAVEDSLVGPCQREDFRLLLVYADGTFEELRRRRV